MAIKAKTPIMICHTFLTSSVGAGVSGSGGTAEVIVSGSIGSGVGGS